MHPICHLWGLSLARHWRTTFSGAERHLTAFENICKCYTINFNITQVPGWFCEVLSKPMVLAAWSRARADFRCPYPKLSLWITRLRRQAPQVPRCCFCACQSPPAAGRYPGTPRNRSGGSAGIPHTYGLRQDRAQRRFLCEASSWWCQFPSFMGKPTGESVCPRVGNRHLTLA